MAKIDEIKEEIAFLKVWLGILVVTLFGMIGWGVSHIGSVGEILLILDFIGVIVLSIVVVKINLAIIKKIKSLREL